MKKFIIWAPRVLAIAFILFLSLFALDSFGTGDPWWRQLLGFLIHLIPNFILIGVLLFSWRHPLAGGLLFIGAGIFYLVMFRGNFDLVTILLIPFPAFLTGGLFIAQKYIK